MRGIAVKGVSVTKAVVHGDASVTASRKKIKHIYDFSVTLDWQFETEEEDYTGKIVLSDVTADFEHEMEVQTNSAVPGALLQKYIKNSTCPLQVKIQETLKKFHSDFLAK